MAEKIITTFNPATTASGAPLNNMAPAPGSTGSPIGYETYTILDHASKPTSLASGIAFDGNTLTFYRD